MNEGDYIGEVGLMVTYKQNILPGKVPKIIGSFNLQMIHNGQSGICNCSYNGVDHFSDKTDVLQPFN
jgi:hypothetical protein